MKKLSNTEIELRKSVAYEKKLVAKCELIAHIFFFIVILKKKTDFGGKFD